VPLGRELIGIPVLVAGGEEPLGDVVDLCFDPRGRLLALAVEPRKGLLRKERLVPMEHFVRITGDGAVLSSQEALDAPLGAADAVLRLRQGERFLVGWPLFGPDGRELGAVSDVALDEESFEIWGFEVSDGTIMDLLEGRAIVDAQGARLVDGGVVLTDLSHMDLGLEGEPRV